MLKSLFKRGGKSARAPDGTRVYGIGDIHGCADQLDSLMATIRQEEAAREAASQLVFLGDYIDRGPESRGVVERLIALKADRPQTVFLKGNHEASLLDFLRDPHDYADWLEWGGAETLESYGVAPMATRHAQDLAAEFRERLPRAHVEFLEGLELWRSFGDYLFVHAGLRPGKPIEEQAETDLLWIRGEFHNSPANLRPEKVVVHGHHPMSKPLDAGWRIAVDTGACFGGPLTAVALEGELRRFISV